MSDRDFVLGGVGFLAIICIISEGFRNWLTKLLSPLLDIAGSFLDKLSPVLDPIAPYVTAGNILAVIVVLAIVKVALMILGFGRKQVKKHTSGCRSCGNTLSLTECKQCGHKYCPAHIHPENHRCGKII